ncbi:imelysin family protein [Marinobacterium jannaschii]|uniref:imelysin family protein n=1 Tax=Marinobacterium jannaschii TaxID=64970 RepID=UPI00055C76F0|nr:imelysin family protein [Marinobacterium jannaschii]
MDKTSLFSRAGLIALLPLLVISKPGLAAPSEQQWAELNRAIAEQHIVPRYQALASASASLKTATSQLCAAPSEATLAAAQQAFHSTMDAWQGIQHVQFGPITTLMRNFSMQFWPDKKNLGGKQLNSLLNAKDHQTLDDEYFRAASIGVKGLPALERLLFGKAQAKVMAEPFACQLSASIAGYVAGMGQETAQEWQQYGQEFVAIDGNGYYEDNTEAATDLMKSLVEPVEVVRDNKLLRPLNKSASSPKPRRAESWRSERSLRNIRINIETLDALYRDTGKVSVASLLQAEDPTRAKQIDSDFAAVKQQLADLRDPIATQLRNPQGYAALKQLSDQLKQLHGNLEAAMQPLNIQLGFNSRDGD